MNISKYTPKNRILLLSIFILAFFKVAVVIYHNFYNPLLVYGADADYYHLAAVGSTDFYTSFWPRFLSYLYGNELYDRLYLSIFIQFLSIVVIPIIGYKIVYKLTRNTRLSLISCLIISIYPSLFMYSGDIYRDIVMVFIFSVSVYWCVSFSNKKIRKVIPLLILISIAFYILYGFRPYLGVALIFSLLMSYVKPFNNVKIFLLIYFLLIIVMNQLGLFEPFYEYRKGFFEMNNGSTMNLDIGAANVVTIIPLFIISYLGQFFGLFLINISSIIVFVLESVPVIYMLLRTNFNILKIRFYRFLFYFIISYNTIWVLANDNLGTATRLRMYSYIAILFLFLGSSYHNSNLRKLPK